MKTKSRLAATLIACLLTSAILMGCPEIEEQPQDEPDPPVEGESEYPNVEEGETPNEPVDPQKEYDDGFEWGFAQDAEYWDGYFDSYETVPDGPILYQGSAIPTVEYPHYDAGYWDGVWYAYNDGYFVCYDYAFTIGFSEGYDLAYRADWQSFVVGDEHPEYLDGSFADGYNDGFSEGRVFGAVDYVIGLPFDWLDAMWDYRGGTDLYIEEASVGTGEYGPVYLYEYGVDPAASLAKSGDAAVKTSPIRTASARAMETRAVGKRAAYAVASFHKQNKADNDEISYRVLTEEAASSLRVTPTASVRSQERPLTLTDSWLERVNAYRAEQ